MKKMLLLANGGHTKVLLKASPYLNHTPNIGVNCVCGSQVVATAPSSALVKKPSQTIKAICVPNDVNKLHDTQPKW